MLSGAQLRDYRELRGLSTYEVAAFCDFSREYVTMIETGKKPVTDNAHDQITNAINKGYQMKKNGTLKAYMDSLKAEKQKETETKEEKKTEAAAVEPVPAPKKRGRKKNTTD